MTMANFSLFVIQICILSCVVELLRNCIISCFCKVFFLENGNVFQPKILLKFFFSHEINFRQTLAERWCGGLHSSLSLSLSFSLYLPPDLFLSLSLSLYLSLFSCFSTVRACQLSIMFKQHRLQFSKNVNKKVI